MLTEEEKKFIAYWEENRDKQKRLSYQLMIGLPLGLIFALPIMINFFAGRLWYKRADAIANTQMSPTVLIVAVAAIAVFIGIFYRKLKWEKNEQFYKELKAKELQP
ncbi:hypothetical protein [Pollutibacter soli]|uniref:hypothetical protein n=1 Tax=Pollutibacter soli TaxID=3034157 RepID=UPI003013D359